MTIVYATCATQDEVFYPGEHAVIQRFMEAYPRIHVEVRRIPFTDYDTQILLSVKGGRPPDVARINHSTLRGWAGAGCLMELDEFIAGSEVIDPADYWPGFWEICRVGGRQYALPLGTDCRVMLYNFALFRRAGLEPPRTWAELLAAARKIHDPAAKIYGLALPSSNKLNTTYDALGNFLVANGGRILNDEGTRAVVAEDRASREAFRFVCALSTTQNVSPPSSANLGGEVIEALFAADRLGILFSGPFVRVNLKRYRPEFEWNVHYGTALIPAGPDSGRSGSAQGGWLIGAFADSPHPAEARLLLEFFSRPESLVTVARVENLPPRRLASDLDVFKDPYYDVFFEQLPTARPPVALIPQLPNVARAIQRAYQRVVSGGADVDESLDWLQTQINSHLLR